MKPQETIIPSQPETFQICFFKSHLWSAHILRNHENLVTKVGMFSWRATKDEIIEDWNFVQMAFLCNEFEYLNYYDDSNPDEIPVLKSSLDIKLYRPSNELAVWKTSPHRRMLISCAEKKNRLEAEDLWSMIQDSISTGDFVLVDENGERME